jgi:hypothetical protein
MGWPSMLEDIQERQFEGLANMRRQAEQFEKPPRTKTLIFKRPERSVGGPLSALLERLNAKTPLQPEAFDQSVLDALCAKELERAKAIKQNVINKQRVINALRAAVLARVAREADRSTSP